MHLSITAAFVLTACLTWQTRLASTTLDLLKPENSGKLVLVCLKGGKVSVTPLPGSNAVKVQRTDGGLENTALIGYFGRTGLLAPSSKTPAEVTLGKVGESLGMRAVVSYNSGARFHLYSHAIRLGLGNSSGTRVAATNLYSFTSPAFADDTGWISVVCVDKSKSSFMRRAPSPLITDKASVLGSINGATLEKEWETLVAKPVFQSGEKVELIFNLTRTGPDSLKLYGFVQGVEQEHVVSGVTDFTFDTVSLLYPVARTNAPAEMVIHEFQIVMLP